MMRAIFSKVMWLGRVMLWLGRGTATVLGLALMLALVVGLASTALAANGQPFLLGKLTNSATAVSRLVGNVAAGPALQIINPNTAASARGLDVLVDAGNTPIYVNSSAGKATNLNADKVDGQDAPLLVRVNANGTLSSDDTVARVTHSPNSGYYQFDFNRPVVGCVYSATLINGPDGGEIAVYPSSSIITRLAVITTRNGLDFNARYDRDFHLILYC